MKKTRLWSLVQDGKSLREIAKIEGRSLGSIRYWMKKYQIKTTWNPKKKSIIYSTPDKDFLAIVENEKSVADCLVKLGVTPRSANYRNFYSRCRDLGVTPPKAKNGAHHKKASDIFIKSDRVYRRTVKSRILKEGLKEYRCEICGQKPIWNNKPLILTLDHINGDPTDNRLENLRFICPNCDRQLPTYCARNRKK